MKRILLLAALPAAFATSALAQGDPHAGHTMPTPTPPAAEDTHADHEMTAPAQAEPSAEAEPTADAHAGHDMSAMADGTMAETPMTGADQPVGEEPPPPTPTDNAADGVYGSAAMGRARDTLEAEHGGALVSKVMANIAEYRAQPDGGGYRWDAEAWFGGDINRLVIKSEGEGADEGVEAAEVQALYSRAVGRYTDIQMGLRHDFEPSPSRTYATIGFETLFPYWFEAEGALFLSEDGDLSGRLEGSYDLRLTQRWVLQPEAELNFAVQDAPDLARGSGLTDAELGLRLRYEVRREFAPYIGVTYERHLDETADTARIAGEDTEDTSFVAGIRAWF